MSRLLILGEILISLFFFSKYRNQKKRRINDNDNESDSDSDNDNNRANPETVSFNHPRVQCLFLFMIYNTSSLFYVEGGV